MTPILIDYLDGIPVVDANTECQCTPEISVVQEIRSAVLVICAQA